ncbi:MAG: aminotransferase class I/II-fold pyridoxal phosphate-dependent enzyme [Intestinimonas sp.]
MPFSIADMDLITAPEIISALREAAEFGVYGYTSMDEAYRSAVAGWMRRRHGWEIQPGWIINAFGVVHAVGQAVQAFTQPGEGVIFQTPAYPPSSASSRPRAGRPFPILCCAGNRAIPWISRRWRPCVPAPTPSCSSSAPPQPHGTGMVGGGAPPGGGYLRPQRRSALLRRDPF